jgi:hypothetical protein
MKASVYSPSESTLATRQDKRLSSEPRLDAVSREFFRKPCAWERKTELDIVKTGGDRKAELRCIEEWIYEAAETELQRWSRKWWDNQTDAVLEARERKSGRALKDVQQPLTNGSQYWAPVAVWLALRNQLTASESATADKLGRGLSARQAAKELGVSQTLIQKHKQKFKDRLWLALEEDAPSAQALKLIEEEALEGLGFPIKNMDRGTAWCRRREALPNTPKWSGRAAYTLGFL